MTVKNIAKHRPLFSFFFLAYLFAWISWLPLILSQTGLGLIPVKISMAYTVIGSYAPLFAVLLLQWLAHHNLKFFHLQFSWKHLLLGLLIGFALIASAFILIPSAIMTRPPLSFWNWKAFLSYPFAIIHSIFLAAGPLGEEPGWRGFALPRLLQKFNPFLASLILGTVWFCWHLPLFLLPAWTSSPMYIYALLVISLSFTMTFIYNISKGNIAIAIIMHGIFNCSPFILNDFLSNAVTKDFISFEQLLALSFLFLAIILLLFTRGKLGYIKSTAYSKPKQLKSHKEKTAADN
ncbi:CPBP family intramembrane glutamic endopeptidase [Parafilimonas sp.]|uniref:CPBP family intramembrane glutamic endopeptidase n=1 Tax=Parafilimonas sp. TaxID=1969739 RepID=UPI003F7CF39D